MPFLSITLFPFHLLPKCASVYTCFKKDPTHPFQIKQIFLKGIFFKYNPLSVLSLIPLLFLRNTHPTISTPLTLYPPFSLSPSLFPPQSAYRGRGEIRGRVSALSGGAYTTTLLVMVDRVKGEGIAPSPPHPHQAALMKKKIKVS